jgi:hypothetical protein
MAFTIFYVLSVILAGAAGFYAGVKNANSSKVAKAKDILDQLKK